MPPFYIWRTRDMKWLSDILRSPCELEAEPRREPDAQTPTGHHWAGQPLMRPLAEEGGIQDKWNLRSTRRDFSVPSTDEETWINSSNSPRGWLRKLELPRSSDKLWRKSSKMAQGRLTEEWQGPTERACALEALNPTLPLTSCDPKQFTNLSKTQFPHLYKENCNGHLVELMWILKMLYKPLT